MRLSICDSEMTVAGEESQNTWDILSKSYLKKPPMSSLQMYVSDISTRGSFGGMTHNQALQSSTIENICGKSHESHNLVPESCTWENINSEGHNQDKYSSTQEGIRAKNHGSYSHTRDSSTRKNIIKSYEDHSKFTDPYSTGKPRHITSTPTTAEPAWESSSLASEDESVSSGHRKMVGVSLNLHSHHHHHNLSSGGECQISPNPSTSSLLSGVSQDAEGRSREETSPSSVERSQVLSSRPSTSSQTTGESIYETTPPSVERNQVPPRPRNKRILQDTSGKSTSPPSVEESKVHSPWPPLPTQTKGILQEASGTTREEASPSSEERRVTAGRVRGAGVLMLLLLLTSPASGRFDKGGPQHSITWGRGNSPSSAVFASPPTNVTAVKGHRARLPCQVKNLGHKDVSWIRQRDIHILTVGIFTYTTDDRFKVHHTPETEDWHLDISSVTFRDSGVYECQVSTSPKASLPITLTVLGQQEAVIRGPREVYVQKGSTISLECEVKAGVEAVGTVRWFQGANPLNYSSPRGGISMELEKTPSLTTSRLHITRADRPDSGNYTCHPLLARPASVTVHVVIAGEESAAAVQSVCVGARACPALVWACLGVVWAAVLILATQHHNQPHPLPHPPS